MILFHMSSSEHITDSTYHLVWTVRTWRRPVGGSCTTSGYKLLVPKSSALTDTIVAQEVAGNVLSCYGVEPLVLN